MARKQPCAEPVRGLPNAGVSRLEPARKGRWHGRRWWFVAAISILGLLATAVLADWWFVVPDTVEPQYVGSHACATCHARQYEQWKQSHHALAMQEAGPHSVLGDFRNAQLTYHGITARMFQRDGTYWIYTEGPDGQMRDYPIKYTFGVAPLQQYLVELEPPAQPGPNTVGRLQVLRESWDTEAKRWFYLPPPDVAERLSPDDDLHWTGIGQRWNTMCAECHSTNVRKNFYPDTGKYSTTFSEISVGCEACHGPGSLHIQLARAYSLFWDRKRGYGLVKMKGDDPRPQLDVCSFCHSRRRVLDEASTASDSFADRCALELPSPATYFADGQMRDEVYEIGSFLQSKMFHQKVRCSDCHDPHSAQLKYSGNAVCTSCHQHPAGRYDTPAHHQHQPGGPGSLCVNCHMPETVYMEVDRRRDHSLRIPRPDLSVAYGVPNACTGCHLDRADIAAERRATLVQYRDWVVAAQTDMDVRRALQQVDAWAEQAVRRWFPASTVRRTRHYAADLMRAWNEDPEAVDDVLRMCQATRYPAVIRAAGWQWLRGTMRRDVLESARQALRDADPLVRMASVGVFDSWIPGHDELASLTETQRRQLAAELHRTLSPLWPLLQDPAKAVRVEAAATLARVPADLLPLFTDGPQRTVLQRAVKEWIDSLQVYNDRAGTYLTLGVYYEAQGDETGAEEAYRTALRIEPRTVGPRSNLAALLERRLERVQWQLSQRPRPVSADAHRLEQEADKLSQQIAQLRAEELQLLARDAQLLPNNRHVLYRYGLALYLNGRVEEAAQVLERGASQHKQPAQFYYALALLYEKMGHLDQAIEKAAKLVEWFPDNQQYRGLLNNLQQQRATSPAKP